jgi:hypothetical protein
MCLDQAVLAMCVETQVVVLSRAAVVTGAKNLKAEAESHLTPSLKIEARMPDGACAATVLSDGTETWRTPALLSLDSERSYSLTASVLAESGFYWTSVVCRADWHGLRTLPITLKRAVPRLWIESISVYGSGTTVEIGCELDGVAVDTFIDGELRIFTSKDKEGPWRQLNVSAQSNRFIGGRRTFYTTDTDVAFLRAGFFLRQFSNSDSSGVGQ